MRRVTSVVAWWVLLVLLWTAYVGTTATLEIRVGLAAAAVAAIAIEVVRSLGLLRFRVDPGYLLQVWKVPFAVVYDFALITWELRRGRVAGTFVEREFAAGDPWRRAFAIAAGNSYPNALVVDIDEERNVAVLHALRPEKWTAQKPL